MKDKLLDIGAQMGMRIGIANITRRGLAAKAKVSEALVSHHLGNREALHKALKRHMKKHGYVEPSAERIAAEGKKLRAKKNPAPARKHSAKEVEAMKRKGVAKKVGKGGTAASRKRAIKVVDTVNAGIDNAVAASVAKTAARAPKLPPQMPLLPALPVIPPPVLPLPLPLPTLEPKE